MTDPKTISIVGSVSVLAQLQAYARSQGLLVQEMHIRGKVHNPENVDLAKELCSLCDRIESLQLPSARNLQTSVRSNRTGEQLTEGSLTHEVVNTILAGRCEWYTLLTELARDLDLSGRRSHQFATFGIGDCVPLSPFHKFQLQITKLDVLSFISDHIASVRAPNLDYHFPDDAVAVIGASCRLPGASNLEELWDLMASGSSRHVEVPTDRFDIHGSFRASQDWKFAGKRKFYGNFVDGVENFDHEFFGTNPKEATNMDPQQRILLELAYEAMESSGYLRTHRRESGDPIGCFIGASFCEFLDNTNANPPSAYTSTGTIRAFLCGRLSYYFGWSGPAEVVDTACSSSLVAINRAVKAVQRGECTQALTGGINIITGINNYLDLAKAGFLSPTGQCKPFDKSADGYCRSEGAGLVVLKLLSQAVTDGNQILGVIPGSSTNQGGLSSALTIPSSPAQVKLYQTCLRQAGMKPEQVSYVEAHGTGTQAGDPLEVASVREAFGGSDRKHLLHLGSIKGNLGHCETAAGVAGLLKVLAMIQKSSIPPLASHSSLNPKIPDLAPDKMCVDAKSDHWNAPLLAACVNSYGAAGSNAALICCEGPPQFVETSPDPTNIALDSTYPIIVSAASKDSLIANVSMMELHLQRTKIVPNLSLGDLAFTLSERRKRHRHAFITTASSLVGLTHSFRPGSDTYVQVPQKPRPVVLAFGGQSKQNVGLEESFYNSHPIYRNYIHTCDDILTRLGFSPILPSIFQSEPISDVVALQCGTFAMQYASAKCWIDAGIDVAALIGHSFGELTALVVSGVLSLQDGLKLIATRASLMKSKWGPERGIMLAIHADCETVQAVVEKVRLSVDNPAIEIACYNAPSSQVVVGNSSSIARAETLLKDESRFQGIRCQRLDVSHGFHSMFTKPLLHDLDQVSASLTFTSSEIPLETCTTEHIDHVDCTRLSQHTRDPVYFSDAVRRIEKRVGPCVWLEAGMNSPIIPMVKRAVINQSDHFFQAVNVNEIQAPMSLLSDVTANLWKQGISASFWNFLSPKDNGYKQISLPPYQFQRTPHWLANIDRVIEVQKNIPVAETPKVEEKRPEEPLRLVTPKDLSGSSKEFQIHVAAHRYKKIVSGHAVRQRPLCPASMYMECAAMAVQILRGDIEAGTLYFENLNFQAALGVDLTREVTLTLHERVDKQSWDFVIKSSSQTDPKPRLVTHGKGKLGLTAQPTLKTYERLISDSMIQLVEKPGTEKLRSNRAYGLFSQVVHYASFLQGISHITMDGRQAVGEIDLPVAHISTDESTVTQYCDTIAIDTFIQVVGLLINSSDLVTSEDVYVATGVDSTSMSAGCDLNSCKSWKVYTKFHPTGENTAIGDIFVLTRDETLVMTVMGVQFTKLLISQLEKFLDSANTKPTQETKPKVKVVASVSSYSAEENSQQESDVPQGLTRATTPASEDGAQTPEMVDDSAAESLGAIIAEYTGLSASEIAMDANVSDLGVDSLAAVELAEELQTRFGKDVDADYLMMSTYEALSKLLLPTTSTKSKTAVSTSVKIDTPTTTQTLSTAKVVTASPKSGRRQDVLKMLSETSGAPVSSIEDGATLQDLGIDSLSAVELKSDIEDAFSVEIDDDEFTLDSTVKEVLVFLGIGDSQESKAPPPAASDSSVASDREKLISADKKPADTVQGAKVAVLANPMEALIKCEAAFNKSASKRGFLDYWAAVAPKQNELLVAYLLEAFQTLKSDLWKIPSGHKIPTVHYLPKHAKVMKRLLQILQDHDILTKQGSDFVRGSKALSKMSSAELHEAFVAQFPAYGGEARLMALTGPKLADCLTGKVDPVGLMFKGAGPQKVMGEYYTESPMLSALTEQLVVFIEAVLAKSKASSDAPIRFFEVGAGFGGTTTRLAEVIEASGISVEYTFTDIGPTLVKNAKSKFAKYSWMNFQTFNLENSVPEVLKDKYDIVIGTNCVHATTNKANSTRRLRELLRKDGFTVLSEVCQIIDWYDIVFGLLDGWWLANDADYPLQPPESWMSSLEEAGYTSVSYSQGPTPESNTQRLLVASTKEVSTPVRTPTTSLNAGAEYTVDTVVYKEVDGTQILADIYSPTKAPGKAMPVGTEDTLRLFVIC